MLAATAVAAVAMVGLATFVSSNWLVWLRVSSQTALRGWRAATWYCC